MSRSGKVFASTNPNLGRASDHTGKSKGCAAEHTDRKMVLHIGPSSGAIEHTEVQRCCRECCNAVVMRRNRRDTVLLIFLVTWSLSKKNIHALMRVLPDDAPKPLCSLNNWNSVGFYISFLRQVSGLSDAGQVTLKGPVCRF